MFKSSIHENLVKKKLVLCLLPNRTGKIK
uniref:Uncharacterized protein n=1 Tax=Rhizophora mucronata TaxID=61149 RepID=A0A2P2NXX2_RHIMU